MKFCYEGSTGGYPLSETREPKQKVICDLCGDECEDDFKLKHITASLSIIVCADCSNQDPIEYQEIIEYIKSKN